MDCVWIFVYKMMLYSTFLSILLNINLAYWWQCSTILSWVVVRTCGQVKILKGVFSHQLRAQQLQVQLCVHQRGPGCGVSSSTIKKKSRNWNTVWTVNDVLSPSTAFYIQLIHTLNKRVWINSRRHWRSILNFCSETLILVLRS